MWDLVNQVGAILGLFALFLGGFVYLFAVGKKGRADVVRQDNKDLTDSNVLLRNEKTNLEVANKEKEETIRYLKDVATQTPAVKKLIEMNMAQQQQINEQHLQVIDSLSKLTGEISHLAAEFSKMAKAINKREVKNGKR